MAGESPTKKAATTPGCCFSAQPSACKELEVSRWKSKSVQGWIPIHPTPANLPLAWWCSCMCQTQHIRTAGPPLGTPLGWPQCLAEGAQQQQGRAAPKQGCCTANRSSFPGVKAVQESNSKPATRDSPGSTLWNLRKTPRILQLHKHIHAWLSVFGFSSQHLLSCLWAVLRSRRIRNLLCSLKKNNASKILVPREELSKKTPTFSSTFTFGRFLNVLCCVWHSHGPPNPVLPWLVFCCTNT